MYQVNDVIVYRGTGVCRIAGLIEKRIGDHTEECYSLMPVYLNNLKIFVPFSLEKRICQVRSPEMIEEELRSIEKTESLWIADVHMRRKKYREIILDGTHDQMMQVLKTLCLAKLKRQFRGQKIGLCVSDDHIYQDCLRIISEEFAYGADCSYYDAEQKVLGIVKDCLTEK
ncbi:MAG: CarD family transcriptional regulator [Ruminococcus sp.]